MHKCKVIKQIKLTDLTSLKFEHKLSQIKMQTDPSNKIFSILKNTSDSLILQNCNHKFIRKTFYLQQQTLGDLIDRQKLAHSNLICLHKIEFSHFLNPDTLAVDIVFDHYCRTLEQCLVGEEFSWDDSEIINTFQPIIQLVDHLLGQKIQINDFSLKNIVITEDQSIKFMDSFLQTKQIKRVQISNNRNNFNAHKIYQKIAENIFSLLNLKDSSNDWKTKMKILKQHSSKEMWLFVSSLLAKSSFKGCDAAKTKKIKKTVKVIKTGNCEQPLGKLQKQEKNQKDTFIGCEFNMYAKHQGKENKLHQ